MDEWPRGADRPRRQEEEPDRADDELLELPAEPDDEDRELGEEVPVLAPDSDEPEPDEPEPDEPEPDEPEPGPDEPEPDGEGPEEGGPEEGEGDSVLRLRESLR